MPGSLLLAPCWLILARAEYVLGAQISVVSSSVIGNPQHFYEKHYLTEEFWAAGALLFASVNLPLSLPVDEFWGR